MPKTKNQKLKILFLMKMLLDETDENHGIDLNYITQKLEDYDISVERKTIYSDIEELKHFGLDINKYKKGKNVYYYVASREFEVAELKLLVDAVQSSKFITEKKSRALIKKLETLTNKYDAKELHRQVYVSGRVKAMNESIYYNVDMLHRAISENKQIKFQYMQWNLQKELVPKHNGDFYCVSPWALIWDSENYYLVAFDEKSNYIKHYRVDKMRSISLLEDERIGKECFKSENMAEYEKKRFSMFDGFKANVEMLCDNSLIGVMLDRFGNDIFIREENENCFFMRIEVVVSNQFLGWISSFGDKIKIISPDEVLKSMAELGESLVKMYK